MAEPFLGEIRITGFNFAPRGWALCDGQFLPIMQNQALFSLLGTTYGGDGRSYFALPDLRGRVPLQAGNSDSVIFYRLGERGGEEKHKLTEAEMPQHDHTLMASGEDGNNALPASRVLAVPQVPVYSNIPSSFVTMNPAAVSTVGQDQGHNNIQPYIALNFIIALQGLFPPRT